MTPTQTSCTIFRGEILQNHYRLALFWTSPISGNLHPRKLRVRHWKSMVWKISRSFWVPAYFQRRTVGFRDGNHKGTLQGTITFPTKQEKENLLHTCLGYWMEIFERSQEGKKITRQSPLTNFQNITGTLLTLGSCATMPSARPRPSWRRWCFFWGGCLDLGAFFVKDYLNSWLKKTKTNINSIFATLQLGFLSSW